MKRFTFYRLVHCYAMTMAFLTILGCFGPNLLFVVFTVGNYLLAREVLKAIRYGVR